MGTAPASSPSANSLSVYDRLASSSIHRTARKSELSATTPVHGSSNGTMTASSASTLSTKPQRITTSSALKLSTSDVPSTPSDHNLSSTSPSQIPVLSSTSNGSILRTNIASRSQEALQRHQERMEKYREKQLAEANNAKTKPST